MTATREPMAGRAAQGDEPRPAYEPLSVVPRYRPPQASVSPDRTKGWIRRLFPLIRANRVSFGLSLGGTFLALVAQVIIPRISGDAVNEALTERTSELAPYVWALLGLATARFVFNYVSRLYLFRSAYGIEFDLRNLMYAQFVRLSFPFYDRVQSGQLISRANSDIRSVQMFLAFAPNLILQFGMVFMALYFMLQVHVLLTLASLVTLPFVYFVGVRMRTWMFPTSWLVQARMADFATIVDENIQGVRVVKSFAAERQQIRALARAAQRLRWASTEQVRLRARYAPIIENLTRVGEAIILLYGGILTLDGHIRVGDLLVFLAYLTMLQVPFRMAGFIIMQGQRAAASAGRIFEVLDEVPDIADRPGAVDLEHCEGEVELRSVRFAYANGPNVLDGLSVRIPAGQTVAVVGRTGSGKTTLAELIPRFYDVDDGAVLVDGHDVRDLTLASLRSYVGVCFNEPFLFSASVRDNIAYGRPDAPTADVVRAAQLAGAHEFIERLDHGYETVVGERGYTLSGGQRQRIAIARTILENPKILILDDATSAIDVKIELEIHDGLRELMSGRTTLIIAHRLSTIGLAERVVLLEGGRVVADGTHADLLRTEPRYAEVLSHFDEDNDEQVHAAAERLEHERAVTMQWERNREGRLARLPSPNGDHGTEEID